MGLYARKDSPYWWMRHGSGPGASTRVLRDGPTAKATRDLRRRAEEIYAAATVQAIRVDAGLEEAPRDAITFDVYADWWTLHRLPRLRSNDRDADRLVRLRAAFGPRWLSAIDRAAVDEYISARIADRVGPVSACARCHVRGLAERGMVRCEACRVTWADTRRTVSAGTINREVDQLKSMLRDACPRYLTTNPLRGVPKLRVVTGQQDKPILTPEEISRIAAELSPARAALFLLCVETLIRFGNAITLTRAEHKGTYLALTDSKTGPYRVQLNARLRTLLASLPVQGEYYFAELRQAKNARDWRGAMRHALRRACQRAGVPYGRVQGGVTFHTATRATGATLQLRNGTDYETVRANGNWKDPRAMQAYLQTNLTMRRAASDAVGDAIAAAGQSLAPQRSRRSGGKSPRSKYVAAPPANHAQSPMFPTTRNNDFRAGGERRKSQIP